MLLKKEKRRKTVSQASGKLESAGYRGLEVWDTKIFELWHLKSQKKSMLSCQKQVWKPICQCFDFVRNHEVKSTFFL